MHIAPEMVLSFARWSVRTMLGMVVSMVVSMVVGMVLGVCTKERLYEVDEGRHLSFCVGLPTGFLKISCEIFSHTFSTHKMLCFPQYLSLSPPVGGNSTYFLLGCEPAKIRSLTN